jgi:predicted protein tyrosine phosphatase
MTLHVLFVCTQNRLRSPTAEQVFADWPGVETASAGVGNDADVPVGNELLAWADLVIVMEQAHRKKLSRDSARCWATSASFAWASRTTMGSWRRSWLNS